MIIELDSSDTFKTLIDKIKQNKRLDSSIHTLKIYVLSTLLSRAELFSEIKNVYENTVQSNDLLITKAFHENGELKSVFYSYKDEDKPLLFILSVTGKAIIDYTIETLIKNLPKTYYLWIPILDFDSLKENIIDIYKSTGISILSFTSIRSLYDKENCSIRPWNERRIEYSGKDATEVIREFRSIYGALPKKIEFLIPNKINFSIDNRNTFIVDEGFPFLDYVFDIIRFIIDKQAKITDALSSVMMKSIADKWIDFEIKPLTFLFKHEKTSDDINSFFELLESPDLKEGRYCVINPVVVSGSLFFSANLLDENKNSVLSIFGNEKSMSILPDKNCDYDTISRFSETINVNFDPNSFIES